MTNDYHHARGTCCDCADRDIVDGIGGSSDEPTQPSQFRRETNHTARRKAYPAHDKRAARDG